MRQIPNALTLLRFAAIPLFVWLLLDERSGPSWPAGIVFGLAAITDQLDGYLARRWRVESQFGKVADPLADRLMIDTAVVLLVALDRLPWVALLILLRDLLLVGGYKLVGPAGLRVRGLAARQDRDLGAVRIDRPRPRHGAGNVVAPCLFLDQPRARRGRGRRSTCSRRGARCASAEPGAGRRAVTAAGRPISRERRPQGEIVSLGAKASS